MGCCVKYYFMTAVWGDWHIDKFLSITLPTLLAEGNLPALSRQAEVHYAIWTNTAGRAALEGRPAIERLRQVIERLDIVAATDEKKPAAVHHIEWWRRHLETVRSMGGIFVTSPPDVAWSATSFANMHQAFIDGREAVMVPSIRVVSETLVPDVISRYSRVDDPAIAVEGTDLARLAARHIHPLTIASMPELKAGRIGNDAIWPAGAAGYVLRQAARPVIAHDTSRVSVTDYQFSDAWTNLDKVEMSDDSKRILMLSLAPLFKDVSILEPGRPVTTADVARWSTHETVDTPANDAIARRDVCLSFGESNEGDLWRRASEKAQAFFADVIRDRQVLKIIQELKEMGCGLAAGILAFALRENVLPQMACPARRLVFAPTDAALSGTAVRPRLFDLCRIGGESELAAALNGCTAVVDGAGWEDDSKEGSLLTMADGAVWMLAVDGGLERRSDGFRVRVLERRRVGAVTVCAVTGWLAAKTSA